MREATSWYRYATDAASVADSVDIIAEGTGWKLETPVLYPVGLVEDQEASDDDKAAAAAFLEYLQSDEALEVFEKYGFAAYVTDENADDAQADDAAEETEEAQRGYSRIITEHKFLHMTIYVTAPYLDSNHIHIRKKKDSNMGEFLSEINWTPLWISMKTGVVATIIAFFLGVFCARKIIKLNQGPGLLWTAS